VDAKIDGHLGVNLDEELLELGAAVPSVQAGDHRATATFNAANRLVVPWRTLCRRRHNVRYADLGIMPMWSPDPLCDGNFLLTRSAQRQA